jgi:hypothetical protein
MVGGAVACAAVLAAIGINSILPPRWQPDLRIKNTGTSAVTVSFKGGDFAIQPGETWRNRFYGGDTVTIRAGEAFDAPARTVSLPERNPKPWTFNPIAQVWTAEVNADDPANIRFENQRFEEVTAPPSQSEPWP